MRKAHIYTHIHVYISRGLNDKLLYIQQEYPRLASVEICWWSTLAGALFLLFPHSDTEKFQKQPCVFW